MSVYKYTTLDGALRYLSRWELRVTPSELFNDPFEMRPLVHVISQNQIDTQMDDLTPTFPKMIAEQLATGALRGIPPERLMQFVEALLSETTDEEELQLFESIRHVDAAMSAEGFRTLRRNTREQVQNGLQTVRDEVSRKLPTLNKTIESSFHETLPTLMGVLCLSRSSKHPLMWAHYADKHQGVMLEFDEHAPCFNRRRFPKDEFGYLRSVVYADARPRIQYEDLGNKLQKFALTKALEWAYEQEERLLWPLDRADRIVTNADGIPVHLISCPPPALRSVTIGCKGQKDAVNRISALLNVRTDTVHIGLRRARMDAEAFALVYEEAFRSQLAIQK